MNKYIGKKYQTRDGKYTAEIVGEGLTLPGGYTIHSVLTEKTTGQQITCTHVDAGRGGLQYFHDEDHKLDLIEVKPDAEKLYTWYYAERGSDAWWQSVRLYTEAQAAIVFGNKLYRRGPEITPSGGEA